MACTIKFRNLLLIDQKFVRTIGMSAGRRAQEILEEMKEKNPYYEKYSEKISKLQQTSPEEFLARVERTIEPSKETKPQARPYTELLKPKSPIEPTHAEIPCKRLSDVMKVELIEEQSAEEISKIWLEYHKTKKVLAATLSVDQYQTLMETAKKYPIFVLPLPRSEGFEFILLQFANNAVHFTPLLAYQVHAENAPECLTLVYYTDVRDKGIVLMRGEYDTNVLNGQEAQCLANELQLFYYKTDENKQKLLDIFTNKPEQFKHMDLIKEIENIQIV